MADQRDKINEGRTFDLEARLLEFAARILRLVESLPGTDAGRHVGFQLLKSGTSPYANHGEAEDAESADDFVHKLKICLKELRETWRWLRLIARVPMVKNPKALDPLIDEADQLIRIFRQSVLTARRNQQRKPGRSEHPTSNIQRSTSNG